MTALPRDAAGNFRPPQYRLDSVRAGDLKSGDVVSWNWRGRAEACAVVAVADEWGFARELTLRGPAGEFRAEVLEGTLVNKIEVARG